jgi:hypothetical protein
MKRFSLALCLLIFFAVPGTVLADIAPPQNPPGSNLDPGAETTQVRMVAEIVLIEVQKDTMPGSLGWAHVTADFTMRNLGDTSESMAVRFPIAVNNGYDNSYPEITNVAIKVGGEQVAFRRANYPAEFGIFRDDIVPWAEFDVAFPVGQDVSIQVAYNLSGTGYSYRPFFTTFNYILETGAGWQDTIGSADIILHLPYEANIQNVIFDEIGWGSTTPGGTFRDTELRWHYEDFEPGPEGPVQDMEFALVAPAAWQAILTERDNVTKNQNDGEAWGRLAKAYKEVFFYTKGYRTDKGGEELYAASIEAYEKCLSLKPDDAEWHAGFADLLAYHSYVSNDSAETHRALEEIHSALQLAPNNSKVLEIAENVQLMFPEGMLKIENRFDFPWLTQTPTLVPTIAPLFDLAGIPGTYQIDPITFDGREAQLTITLRSDFSADMETKFEDGQTYIASGSWKAGDITITVSLVDQFNEPIDFELFVKEPPSNNLEIFESPPTYSFETLGATELIKMEAVSLTPTDTPAPTDTPPPTSSGMTTTPQISPLVCGATVLVLLVSLMWFVRKRR